MREVVFKEVPGQYNLAVLTSDGMKTESWRNKSSFLNVSGYCLELQIALAYLASV